MTDQIAYSPTSDQYDIASLEILNKIHLDLFPKKATIYDDHDSIESCSYTEMQIRLLSGEYSQYIGRAGKLNEDIIILTNYRLFLSINNETSFINIPIMLIESVEMKELLYIYVYLKNTKIIKLTFATNEKCLTWYQRLVNLFSKITKLDELFSFTFYSWFSYEKQEQIDNNSSLNKCDFDKFDPRGLILQEFQRMNFDKQLWRVSYANKNYKLCPTYPEFLIVPQSITDEQLQKIANFRSSRRFPAVVWKSKKNDCVMTRSSQPNVGLLAWRLTEDELLLKAIANNCSGTTALTPTTTPGGGGGGGGGSTPPPQPPPPPPLPPTDTILLIIDARCRSVALANRVKGGGYEYCEYYTNCEIQFMNLENIHVIRSSFQSLRSLCQTVQDNKTFYSQLEKTQWLHHLSAIIKAARTVVHAIDGQSKPVLIHCSDGWDRTPQILALSKLLLDPYYRTIKGFQTLIELEWLMFGHKFAQRNGHAINHTDVNERCPVFLQWLDCVYQMQKQFPWAFEFNETFLLKLCFHSYSCLFGTFLCDSHEERTNEHVFDRTFSVWSYLANQNNKQFINYLYDESNDQVLYPSYELVNLSLWFKLFCDSDITYLVQEQQQDVICSVNTNNKTAYSDSKESSTPTSSPPIQHLNSLQGTETITTTATTLPVLTTTNGDGNKQSQQQPQQQQQTQPQQMPKTRSFNDFSKCLSVNGDDHMHLNTISNGDPIQTRSCSESNLLADALENLNYSGSSVGSNCSTSQFNHHFNNKTINLNNNSNNNNNNNNTTEQINNKCLTTQQQQQTKPSSVDDTTSSPINSNNTIKDADTTNCVSSQTTTTATDTNIEITNESSNGCNDGSVKYVNGSTNSAPIDIVNSNNSIYVNNKINRMQRSTDTIVDDEFYNNNDNLNTDDIEIEHTNDLSSNINNNNSSSSSNGLKYNNINKVTSNGDIVDGNNKKTSSNSTLNNNEWQLKSVSTSTSGLSEYIVSSKFRVINDQIKKFEQTFNTNNNFSSRNNRSTNHQGGTTELSLSSSPPTRRPSIPNDISTKLTKLNGLKINNQANNNHINSNKINEFVNKLEKSISACEFRNNYLNDGTSLLLANNKKTINNNTNGFNNTSQITFKNDENNINNNNNININNNYNNDKLSTESNNINHNVVSEISSSSKTFIDNNNYTNNNSNNNNPPSASFLSASNNYNTYNNSTNKKKICQLIDVDGLTLVEENCFKRIIEREEEYKNEIVQLKQQIQKCKLFLNTLSSNSIWNDVNYDSHHIDIDKNYEERNGRTHSFSNDSTCSSWDEIEEPEYKMTTWIPDHYVTQCQHCSQKFNCAIRKHHCRNCGGVFCYKCSNQYFPLPTQNLINPVRICISCKPIVEQLIQSTNNNNNNHQATKHTSSPSSTTTSSILIQQTAQQQASQQNIATNSCNLNANRYNNMMHKSSQNHENSHQSQKVSV